MNHTFDYSSNATRVNMCHAGCSRRVEALPGGILVCLLFLEAGAGMRLPLPSPRALDSEMAIVVLATPVLTVFPCACESVLCCNDLLREFCLQPSGPMRWDFQASSPEAKLSWQRGQWLQCSPEVGGLQAVLWACSVSLSRVKASEQRGHWVKSALRSHSVSKCSVRLAISTTCLHWRQRCSIGQCFQ